MATRIALTALATARRLFAQHRLDHECRPMSGAPVRAVASRPGRVFALVTKEPNIAALKGQISACRISAAPITSHPVGFDAYGLPLQDVQILSIGEEKVILEPCARGNPRRNDSPLALPKPRSMALKGLLKLGRGAVPVAGIARTRTRSRAIARDQKV